MDDPGAHRTELGDLLFQVVFQSALREREGHFDLEGVIEAIVYDTRKGSIAVYAPPRSAERTRYGSAPS